MTRIYLDTDAIVLPPTEGGTDRTDVVPAPRAVDALRHLADGGHELVLIGAALPPELDDPDLPLTLVPALPPASATRGAWLVTGDPDACTTRGPGLRTLLVGPRRPPSNRPAARCDVEARDLAAAAIEILTREAM